MRLRREHARTGATQPAWNGDRRRWLSRDDRGGAQTARRSSRPSFSVACSFELLDVPEFRADRAYSLIFSNATFQWIPDHRALFGACFDALRPAGTIVVQMPANETETAKMEIGRLAREAPWNSMLGGRERAFHEEPPEFYAAMLAKLGYDRIDCYHLTFHHPMDRPADVVQWYRSTGLRPFLDALPKRSSRRISRTFNRAAQRGLRHCGADDVRLQAAVHLGPPSRTLRWLARAIFPRWSCMAAQVTRARR